MPNFIKKFFIKHNTSVNQKNIGLKSYPISLDTVGFFCSKELIPDTNLITKLKSNFGNHTQFLIFVLSSDVNKENYSTLSMKNFDLFGRFKDATLMDNISRLDMLIDMSQMKSLVKDYATSMCIRAYKISLGQQPYENYHLSINLKTFNQEKFADEIIKYHNILKHG